MSVGPGVVSKAAQWVVLKAVLRAGEKAAPTADLSGKTKCARWISSARPRGFSKADPSAALKAERSVSWKAEKWVVSRVAG